MPRWNAFATLTRWRDPEWDAGDLDLRNEEFHPGKGYRVAVEDLLVFSGLERLYQNRLEADRQGVLPIGKAGDLFDNRGRILARQYTTGTHAIARAFERRVSRGRIVRWIDVVSIHEMPHGQYALVRDRFRVSGNRFESAVHSIVGPMDEYDWSRYFMLVVDFEEVQRPRIEVRVGRARVDVVSRRRIVVRGARRVKRSISSDGRWRIVRVSWVTPKGKAVRRIFVFVDGVLRANVPNAPGVYGGPGRE